MSLEFAGNFSQGELKQIQDGFSLADSNKDGCLDFAEFSVLISPYILVEDQLKRLFDLFDINKDGRIDIKEFVSALAVNIGGTPQQKLEALFKLYDLDGNNVLSQDEVSTVLDHLKRACDKVMSKAPEPNITATFSSEVIKKLDLNQDGKITLEEWITGGLKVPQLLALLGINV